MRTLRIGAAAVLFSIPAGCSADGTDASEFEARHVTVSTAQRFSFGDTLGDIADIAAYRQADGTRTLIAAVPSRDLLAIIDSEDGRILRTIGARGSGIGQIRSPVSVVVLGDSIALVAERGNRRVQGFQLPAFTSVGTFGERVFRAPAGITAHRESDAYLVSVTDNADTAESAAGTDGVPRLQQFRLSVANGELVAVHWRSPALAAAGEIVVTTGAIVADAVHKRLFIVARTRTGDEVRVHAPDGRFTGRVIAIDTTTRVIGGLSMYSCGEDGHLLIGGRAAANAAVHVFDRRSFGDRGSFRTSATVSAGALTVAGDSLAATVVTVSGGALERFSWNEVAAALALPAACSAR